MTLLTVAVVGVGLFGIPSTVSLFAGQHSWYDPNELSCYKCHMDIKDELVASENKIHFEPWAQSCEGCHRTPTLGNSGNSSRNGGAIPFFYDEGYGANRSRQGFHAATTLECTACHVKVAVSAYSQDNYNSSNGTWSANSLGSPQEAHLEFALQSVSNRTLYYDNGTAKPGTGNQSVILLKGANTACVGCHTHIWINTTWRRNSGYGIIVDETSGKYNLTFWLNNTVKESIGAASNGT